MANRKATSGGPFGVSLFVSTVIHLAVFLLLIWAGKIFPTTSSVQETYYVDVVNLPVASPRAGSPIQKGNDTEASTPPAPSKDMTLPAPQKRPPRLTRQPVKKVMDVKSKPSAAESNAVAEKIAKLRDKTEAQQQEATMERLRRKVATSGTGRSGMPGGTGSEAGSRYEDYLKSRLEDALKKTSMSSTPNPVVVVRLTINVEGKISRQKIERSSGDYLFERAVQNAIEKVSETLIPPPNHKVFESGFIFKPRSIANTKS